MQDLDWELIKEVDKRLASKMIKVDVAIKLDQRAHVPDTLTRIRVLPTVAVVGQSDRVERSSVTGTVLECYIKFLPNPGSLYNNLLIVCKLIKALPDVKMVRVIRVGSRPVTFKGKPILV
jgi:hypothetical protein